MLAVPMSSAKFFTAEFTQMNENHNMNADDHSHASAIAAPDDALWGPSDMKSWQNEDFLLVVWRLKERDEFANRELTQLASAIRNSHAPCFLASHPMCM